MLIKNIEPILSENGLTSPVLNALVPDSETYTTLLLQPDGVITADINGFRNLNDGLNKSKHKNFLQLAKDLNSDIAVTPEYSCPWSLIIELVSDQNRLPNDGKIWLIGCESIKRDVLLQLEDKDYFKWIFNRNILGTGDFLNPLIYVYKTTKIDGQSCWVGVIQFKTKHSGDPIEQLERDHMIKGQEIYSIGSTNSIRLSGIICSDALEIDQGTIDSHFISNETLLIHIQLNPSPRHAVFISYRDQCFRRQYEHLDIICLNWARNTRIKPIELVLDESCGTAIYTKSNQVKKNNAFIGNNHQNGLYITRLVEYHAWGYYVCSHESVFNLRNTKVSQKLSDGAISQRTGPEMINTYQWVQNAWTVTAGPMDNYDEECRAVGLNIDMRCECGVKDVLNIERLLALSNGQIDKNNWYQVENLKPFLVGRNGIINRVTCNIDNTQEATEIRSRVLTNASYLLNRILNNIEIKMPKVVSEFKGNNKLTYNEKQPHINLHSIVGKSKATVSYIGQIADDKYAKSRFIEIANTIGNLRERLVVWYSNNDKPKAIFIKDLPRCDRDDETIKSIITEEDIATE